jgi:sulfate adenylyltransferase subunit 1
MFFDPYTDNRQCGAFILIDPITTNPRAVGMIIDRVEASELTAGDDIPTLNLPKLGIAPEHYEAVERAVKELERQGIGVKIVK